MYDRIFWEHRGETQHQIHMISELYNLPTIDEKFEISDSFFHYIKKKQFFILLILYDGNGRILLQHDEKWVSIPWSSIHHDESLQACIKRIGNRLIENVEIGDVLPIYKVINQFYNRTWDQHTHTGIVYMARVAQHRWYNTNLRDGMYIHINQIDLQAISTYANKQILEGIISDYQLILTNEQYCVQDEEIETNRLYNKRYNFHNKIVKPLIKACDTRKVKMKKELAEYLWTHKRILDVSCWDDSTIIDALFLYHNQIDIAIGNDISRSQIEILSSLRTNQCIDTHKRLFFTNHNASSLPFKQNSFDVVLCKNTLHHMPNKDALEDLLKSCFSCWKELLIVEIENPLMTWWVPKWLHTYWYRGFLKDVGWAYFSKELFTQVIENFFQWKADISFTSYSTLQWNYMIAHIKKYVHNTNNHHIVHSVEVCPQDTSLWYKSSKGKRVSNSGKKIIQWIYNYYHTK